MNWFISFCGSLSALGSSTIVARSSLVRQLLLWLAPGRLIRHVPWLALWVWVNINNGSLVASGSSVAMARSHFVGHPLPWLAPLSWVISLFGSLG